MRNILLLFCATMFFQCTDKVIEGEDLSDSDIEYIQSLGILDEGESIIKFYSNYTIRTSGNFYTNKRIASYWQYEKSPKDNFIESVKYDEVDSLTMELGDGFERTSAIVAHINSNKKLKVYFNANKEALNRIFNQMSSYVKGDY